MQINGASDRLDKRKRKELQVLAAFYNTSMLKKDSTGTETQREETETYREKRELRLIPCIIPVTIERVLFRERLNPISTR